MILAARNLTEQSVSEATPWTFQADPIPDAARTDKSLRQQFYRNPTTKHCFYSLVEGENPRQRTSKENPPRLLHGIVGDFDLPVSEERAWEYINAAKQKPAWIERSIGGNLRLLFLFPRPLFVDTPDFATFLLEKAISWLALDLLPGLDRGAITDPNRLYCCGSPWIETKVAPISAAALQAFFVDAAREFRFNAVDGIEIPLDIVEPALKAKYENFNWPNAFELETSGPSFWVAGSTSTNSAILKTGGFLTFSAHASKGFFSWADLLGAEFCKKITDAALSKATSDIYYDGKQFYRKKQGLYTGMPVGELVNYLEIDCGLKGRQLKQAQSHIYSQNHVENAAPYLFRPSGLINYMGRRRLNTTAVKVLPPAEGAQTWGGCGNFSFLSALLDNLFTTAIQRDHFLAWFQYFYNSGLNCTPMPGQAVFLMGGVGVGKTFVGREVVGRAVGGYVDASSYVLRGAEFTSHLFEHALWNLDDDTISDSPQAAQNVQSMLKKSVANSSFLSNKKFAVAGMLDWMGRIIATTNLDYLSSRILGPLDNSSFDKISVFRCEKEPKLEFPARAEIEKLTSEQISYFLRWLVDWTPPDYVERNSRFGYKSYHDGGLMDQAGQTSKAAPFKEILIDSLGVYFADHPEATEWRGTTTKLIQLLHLNYLNEGVIRTLRLEQISRYLESIEREGVLQCRTESGPLNTRVWIFSKSPILGK